MLTRLILSDSEQNIRITKKILEKKYGNIDELFQRVQKDGCNIPEIVDDYMLWHSINMILKDQNKTETFSSDPNNKINIRFREEIIYKTSDFYSVLTPRRVEILDYIHTNKPASVKNLALETKRDYKNVYDDVLALEKFDLLEFVREGKNKRPVSRVTGIEISFDK